MIEVRNVSKTFYVPLKVKALVDVSTEIAAGEVVVVIGPSGSGKRTFLRCLNHLETADAGGPHPDRRHRHSGPQNQYQQGQGRGGHGISVL